MKFVLSLAAGDYAGVNRLLFRCFSSFRSIKIQED